MVSDTLSHLVLLLILLVCIISTTECLKCYSCSNIEDDSLCTVQNSTICGQDEACYKVRLTTNGKDILTFGCRANAECSNVIDTSAIIGRSIKRQLPENCTECCSTDLCNTHLCRHPVNGEWDTWSVWSNCDVTCGNGTQTRTRSCTSPRPEYGGLDCVGSRQEVQPCETATSCPAVNGEWGTWSAWSNCDVTCDNGTQTRTRSCTNPTPEYGGLDCVGTRQETQPCDTATVCPDNDCSDIKRHQSQAQDGVYGVRLWRTHRNIHVYCDMTTDGGGWTVFQNRYDNSTDFYKNYHQYLRGFGNLHGNFFLNLRYIQEMSTHPHAINELRIDLMSANGTTGYEVMNNFSLSMPNFVLHVGETTSSKNIALDDKFDRFAFAHNGQGFSTYNHDVDSSGINCASSFHGAFWYNGCLTANLNGQYLTPGDGGYTGMRYDSFDWMGSLKQSRMSFRRRPA